MPSTNITTNKTTEPSRLTILQIRPAMLMPLILTFLPLSTAASTIDAIENGIPDIMQQQFKKIDKIPMISDRMP